MTDGEEQVYERLHLLAVERMGKDVIREDLARAENLAGRPCRSRSLTFAPCLARKNCIIADDALARDADDAWLIGL